MRKLICIFGLLVTARAGGQGLSAVSTYKAVVSKLDTVPITGFTLSIEAGASQGFQIAEVCASYSAGPQNVALYVTVQRRNTASSGGTLVVNEATGTNAVSRLDPADPEFFGTVRLNGTLGAAGALLDYQGSQMSDTSAGGPTPFCMRYADGKRPRISAGTGNGVSISVVPDRANTSGRPSGGISVTLIAG